jgi:hypothetical protein
MVDACVVLPADDPIVERFDELVNMGPATLENWLETHAVNDAQASGRHIVSILHKKKSEYTFADTKRMHEVVALINRHLTQRPPGETRDTRWAHALKNWGHDPEKS